MEDGAAGSGLSDAELQRQARHKELPEDLRSKRAIIPIKQVDKSAYFRERGLETVFDAIWRDAGSQVLLLNVVAS